MLCFRCLLHIKGAIENNKLDLWECIRTGYQWSWVGAEVKGPRCLKGRFSEDMQLLVMLKMMGERGSEWSKWGGSE